jgi:hypothetical protein
MDDKAKQLLKQIEDRIVALANETDSARFSKTFQSYLHAMSMFHQYSFRNQLLIYFTNPSASRVAGYKDWIRKFNRRVKKGEHGIAILAPVVWNAPPKSIENSGEEDTTGTSEVEIESSEGAKPKAARKYLSFRTAYVFDVSQTEGDPIPEAPNWHDFEKNPEVEAALRTFAESKGITIEVTDDLGGADGASSGGKIEILPNTGTRTLIHELAHEILHWGRPQLGLSRKEKEIEADATAYVVGQYFNLNQDAQATPNYLAQHRANGNEILDCFNRIRETSLEIIKAIESAMTKRHEGAV